MTANIENSIVNRETAIEDAKTNNVVKNDLSSLIRRTNEGRVHEVFTNTKNSQEEGLGFFMQTVKKNLSDSTPTPVKKLIDESVFKDSEEISTDDEKGSTNSEEIPSDDEVKRTSPSISNSDSQRSRKHRSCCGCAVLTLATVVAGVAGVALHLYGTKFLGEYSNWLPK
jgi:hypothetical protein